MKCKIRLIRVYKKDSYLGFIAEYECSGKFCIWGYKGGIYFDQKYDSVESALNRLYVDNDSIS